MTNPINHSLALVVLELYVQAILDADFHLDWTVSVRVAGQSVHRNVHLADDVTQTAYDRHSQEIPKQLNERYVIIESLKSVTKLTLNGRSTRRTLRRAFRRSQTRTGTMCSE